MPKTSPSRPTDSNRPLRVLLISHTCQSLTEGQPKAHELARFDDVELHVLVPDRWKHYGRWRGASPPQSDEGAPQFGFQVGRVWWPWTGPGQFYLHWYPELARLLRTFRPDVIDLWEEPWGLVSAHACLLRDRILPGAKIVSETEQNIDKRLPPPFETLRSYTLRRADFAVARNSEAVGVLRGHGFRGPVEVVPNAVDAALFQPLDRAKCRRELAAELNWTPEEAENRFIVGYVGRLVESKGLADIVEALQFCGPQTHLAFVGAGEMAEELARQAAAIGKASQLSLLPARPLQELPQFMNALDVFVLASRTTPSWKEQFGRVIIEAHACATPVIGSQSGAIPDVVGEGGLLVPESDPKALGAALETLRLDPKRCRELGQKGLEQARELYTWAQVAARMRHVYRTACGLS